MTLVYLKTNGRLISYTDGGVADINVDVNETTTKCFSCGIMTSLRNPTYFLLQLISQIHTNNDKTLVYLDENCSHLKCFFFLSRKYEMLIRIKTERFKLFNRGCVYCDPQDTITDCLSTNIGLRTRKVLTND